MAGSTSPIFVAVPRTTTVRASAANTGRDGSGTVYDVFAAATNGSRCERVVVKANATTTAGMIRFYHYDGTNTRLIHEIAVTAATPSATVTAFESEWARTDGLPVWSGPTTSKLQVSTHNGETFEVTGFGGDF